MPITEQEIAELAGVSRGTVDRALKNRPGVSLQTKEKILKIAEEHNYKPNIIGKALVYSNRTIPIEIILNSVGNTFFDEIKRGISDAQKEYSNYGISVNINEIKGYNPNDFLDAISTLPNSTKALILSAVEDENIKNKIDELVENGTEVITLSSDLTNSKRLSYVGCDYYKSGETAGRLIGLISSGKAKLCIVTGNMQHVGHRQRVEGIKNVISEYKDISISDVVENNDDDDKAYLTMKNVLAEKTEIDFICITAGGVAGTLKAIKESKRKIKVTSFDETVTTKKAMQTGEIAATVCQQPYEQGYNSVKSVFDTIVAKSKVPEYQHSQLYIKVDKSL